MKTIWRASLWLALGFVLCPYVESYLLPIRISRSLPWKSWFEAGAWSERGSAYFPLFRGYAPRGPAWNKRIYASDPETCAGELIDLRRPFMLTNQRRRIGSHGTRRRISRAGPSS